tara:strand:+ start:1423 stop:1659 length:237 start_codon:yes stop_codon:yes gene_type:complete
MRIIVEQSAEETENKRRTVVECESDEVNLDETLDMILRGLLAYGYAPGDIGDTLTRFTSPPAEQPEQPENPQGELGEI